MTLVVDIGNSTLASAAFQNDQLISRLSLPSKKQSFLTESWRKDYIAWTSQFSFSHLIISSVIPSRTERFLEFIQCLGPKPILFQKKHYSCLPVSLINPQQIGTDLIANAVGAWMQARQACIVVDFGTALSVTMVNDQAMLCGVSISPGIQVALNALLHNTEQLEQIPLAFPESILGKDTTQAIQAGTIWGYQFLVEGIVAQAKKELGQHTKVFITGGLSTLFSQKLPLPAYHYDLNLTLDGIYQIGQLILKYDC